MQQTNDALQELNNTRVLTEADQVRRRLNFRSFEFVFEF